MSIDSHEQGKTFVLFQAEERGAGQATMPDAEYEPDSLIAHLQQQLQDRVKMITAVHGLTQRQIAVIDRIIDYVDMHKLPINTDGGLRDLLRFRPRFAEVKDVRKAMHEALPNYQYQSPETAQWADMTELIFDLYAEYGDDLHDFELAVDNMMAEVSPTVYDGCLAQFHVLLLEVLPEIRKKLAEMN